MKNNYEIRGDIVAILLDSCMEAKIDTDDLQKVKNFKGNWIVNNSNPGKLNYVYGFYNKRQTLLHRYIMGTPKGLSTDHINHDGLNNCKSNLRIVTHGQNLQNRNVSKNSKSGVRGVYWEKERNAWAAQIIHNKKKIYREYFDSIIDAEINVINIRKLLFPYSI